MSRVFSIEDGSLDQPFTAKATKNREYIDIDNSFAFKGSGDVFKKTNAASVKQAIKTLLMTNRMEKPFSPYFGANLQQYLFELADQFTTREVRFAIEENIRVFEKRVDPNTLKVLTDVDADNNSISITIIFTIVNSNETVEFTTRLNRLR
jgi:phage baseplate assembly protein W